MFNKTYITRGQSGDINVEVDVTEKRAPTDESVKLLREMQEKAEAARIATMQIPGNLFHGNIEIARFDHDHTIGATAIFDLNGQRLVVRERVWNDGTNDRDALLTTLRDAMAKEIANKILRDFLVPKKL